MSVRKTGVRKGKKKCLYKLSAWIMALHAGRVAERQNPESWLEQPSMTHLLNGENTMHHQWYTGRIDTEESEWPPLPGLGPKLADRVTGTEAATHQFSSQILSNNINMDHGSFERTSPTIDYTFMTTSHCDAIKECDTDLWLGHYQVSMDSTQKVKFGDRKTHRETFVCQCPFFHMATTGQRTSLVMVATTGYFTIPQRGGRAHRHGYKTLPQVPIWLKTGLQLFAPPLRKTRVSSRANKHEAPLRGSSLGSSTPLMSDKVTSQGCL
ncbi:hypothetical protein BJY52DRAFT_1225702 [Lactarius psammicola]|nr:hypothetical protein BJY52DRAFT_1225702 [Lactarius psammicola]